MNDSNDFIPAPSLALHEKPYHLNQNHSVKFKVMKDTL